MRKENITRRALRIYHAYNPRYFPTVLTSILFESFAPYFTLWMSAEVVTALYTAAPLRRIYLLVAVTLAGNLLVRTLGAILKRNADTQREILTNNESAAFNVKTMSLDYEKLEDPAMRLLRRRVTENTHINGYGTQFLRNVIELTFKHFLSLLFSMMLFVEMASLIVAAGLDWRGLILFAVLLAAMGLNFVVRSRRSGKIATALNEMSAFMLEENRISAGYEVDGMDNRIYLQQPILDTVYAKLNKKHLTLFSKVCNTDVRLQIPVNILERVCEYLVYLIVCLYCTLGAFPIGGIIKYVGYLGKLTRSIGDLLICYHDLKTNEPFLKLYLEFFDIPNDLYQGSLSIEKRSDKKFDIEFRNVSFRYPGTEAYALQNINLHLEVGKRLAVVGLNGSGKTTFIKLLCRLYDPTEGEIIMNDFNIRKYDYEQYLALFSVVFQDYKLLSVPLGDNIAAKEQYDGIKIERILNEVGFGARYAELPEGLKTSLYKNFDENGINVSGGEAQKIALARALYKDAPFIILDEPTAALDPIAEADIYAKFDEIVGDKTAIYISHRLSSCRFCDRIVVFDHGRIIQSGTHDELLADEDGRYFALWQAQAQYYTEKT